MSVETVPRIIPEELETCCIGILRKYLPILNRNTLTLRVAYQYLIGRKFLFMPTSDASMASDEGRITGGTIIAPQFTWNREELELIGGRAVTFALLVNAGKMIALGPMNDHTWRAYVRTSEGEKTEAVGELLLLD